MSKLIMQLVLTGLAASVSPLLIIVYIDILSFKNAVKNSLSFLLGSTASLIVLGIAGVYIFQVGYSSFAFSGSIKSYIDITLGIACFGLLLYFRRKRPRQGKDGVSKIGDSITPSKAFILGGILMGTNSKTLVIFISGLRLIGTASLGGVDDILLLGFLTLITLTTLIIPILLYVISPKKAGKLLTSIGNWLNAHSKTIGETILIVFGFYLIARGLLGL